MVVLALGACSHLPATAALACVLAVYVGHEQRAPTSLWSCYEMASGLEGQGREVGPASALACICLRLQVREHLGLKRGGRACIYSCQCLPVPASSRALGPTCARTGECVSTCMHTISSSWSSLPSAAAIASSFSAWRVSPFGQLCCLLPVLCQPMVAYKQPISSSSAPWNPHQQKHF